MSEQQKERPVFLTVICILSFIGIGFAILGSIMNLALAPMMKEMSGVAQAGMDQATGEISSQAPGMLPFVQKIFGSSMAMMEHLVPISLVNLICSGIALFGVIKMWQLKKFGFYLFAGGKIIIIIAPLIIVGGLMGGLSLVGAIFPIAFIVMYALNLKAME
jgi:hypothetical protein